MRRVFTKSITYKSPSRLSKFVDLKDNTSSPLDMKVQAIFELNKVHLRLDEYEEVHLALSCHENALLFRF